MMASHSSDLRALVFIAWLGLFALGACDTLQRGLSADSVITPETPPPPGLDVLPTDLVFQCVPPGQSATKSLVIKNKGSGDLVISAASLDAEPHFAAQWTFALPVSIKPQLALGFPIQFTANDKERHGTIFRITTNDPDQKKQRQNIRVYNLPVKPKIRVTDSQDIPDDRSISYGTVRLGESAVHTVTVENTDCAELIIDAVGFDQSTSMDFDFENGAAPPVPITLAPVGATGGAPAKAELRVKYTPGRSDRGVGNLAIRSNDPDEPIVLVHLEGGVFECQQPVARCPNPGIANELEVRPLDTITLDCSPSSDPQGRPLTYSWDVTSRPAGSTSSLNGTTNPRPQFFVDLATTPTTPYRFKCTVQNPCGKSDSCELSVLAVPTDALHVQLVWNTDTVDVDMHLLNVGASSPNDWFAIPQDCYYLNRTPDWGIRGNQNDNARLDIDDVNGFGPENVNISIPVAGTYTVGVHYFCDKRQGATTATLRIYCNGAQAAEFRKNLARTGVFWDVATIGWPGCAIRELGATRTVPQGCVSLGN